MLSLQFILLRHQKNITSTITDCVLPIVQNGSVHVFAWLFPLHFSYLLFLMLIAASVVFKPATIAC